MCPYIPDDQNNEEEKPKAHLSKEEEERLMNFIIQEATEQDIIDHIKAGFQKFGIEGTEEVFRRVYEKCPAIMERYQKLYNKLIGRTI